jgi:hypothetical protein
LEAFPLSGLQRINLRLDDVGLHLTEHGFAFLQAKPDLFCHDSRGCSQQGCNQLPLQNSAGKMRLEPGAELH